MATGEIEILGMNTQPLERLWITQARAGSPEAFGHLMELHEPGLLAFVRSRTHNPELSEELVQETFVRAFQYLERFDPERDFEAWLFSIAHHVELEWRRRERIGRRVLGDVAAEKSRQEEKEQAPSGAPPVYYRVMQAISECPPQYHLPLTMRYLDRLRYEEIAEMLKLSTGQVKGLLYRGKQLLKERLTDLLENMEPNGTQGDNP